KTIHKLLDKHQLQVCYSPTNQHERTEEQVVADSRSDRRSSSDRIARIQPDKLRAQSPDFQVPFPSPEVLGVKLEAKKPPSASLAREATEHNSKGVCRWHASGVASTDEEGPTVAARSPSGPRTAVQVGLKMTSQDAIDLFEDDNESKSGPNA